MWYLKKIYDWVLTWAHTPYGIWALFVLAFAESSFFPIPPDVLLVALAISVPAKAFKYAAVCTAGSVLGGAFGYAIGLYFMEAIGYNIVEIYGLSARFEHVGELYREYDAWAVAVAGFTPIPYKVFTITAGAFDIDFKVFLLTSFLSRGARFFLVAAFIYKFGAPVKEYIEKYFNILTIAVTAIVILGFVVIKYVVH